MPPKAKFSREEIIKAALDIVVREGFDALTARSLAAELGSSPRPIFTVFESMDEVQQAVISAATELYNGYEDEGMDAPQSFKGSGIGYIKFAAEQPKLFQLLFMKEKESVPDVGDVLTILDSHHDRIVDAVMAEYGFGRDTAKQIYLHMWIYSHGIATLIANNVCHFTEKEISEMLTDVAAGVIRKYKAEGRI